MQPSAGFGYLEGACKQDSSRIVWIGPPPASSIGLFANSVSCSVRTDRDRNKTGVCYSHLSDAIVWPWGHVLEVILLVASVCLSWSGFYSGQADVLKRYFSASCYAMKERLPPCVAACNHAMDESSLPFFASRNADSEMHVPVTIHA